MATQTKNPMTEMFQQFNDQFTRTVKAGAEFQEQTASFWKGFFEQGTCNFREQFEKSSNEVLPFGQANVERFQKMFDQEADRTVELMHQAFEIGKADGPASVYDELFKVWRRSFDNLRSSNEMFAKANAEMFEQFSKFSQGFTPRKDGKPQAQPKN